MPTNTSNARISELISSLSLEPHIEGGWFRRSYEPVAGKLLDTSMGKRFSMTCIYYLLTADSPVGHFHRNRSDIVHFFHEGEPVTYYLLGDTGELIEYVMGPDTAAGQHPQLVVPGGFWKASRMAGDGSAGYTLIGEAVSPGFEFEDMSLADPDELSALFPRHAALVRELSRKPG